MAVNEVRQILMNELGLTREAVRSEMRDIVRDCVDRHVAHLNLDGIVAQEIAKALRKGWDGSEKAFRDAMVQAVADEAKRQVEDHFNLTITRR